MTKYVEAFEYRGRPPGSIVPPSWSVTLGAVADDGFGGSVVTFKGPLTPDEAAAQGLDLAAILGQATAAALAKADAAAARIAALEARLAALGGPAA